MGTQIASRSQYTTTYLSTAGQYDVVDVSQQAATIAEIANVANHQVAQVGAHAVGTMAQLVQGANEVTRQLQAYSHGSPLFDDCREKILQVTGTNLITLANTAQQEILRQANKYMR